MKVNESRSDLAIKLAVCIAMIASLFGCGGVPRLAPRNPTREVAHVRMIPGDSEAIGLDGAPVLPLDVRADTSGIVKSKPAGNGRKQLTFWLLRSPGNSH
jgi:hypothetical protein